MVIADGLRLAIPGLLAGVAIALAVTRIARSMLFDVSPADPLAFTVVGVGGLLIALMACFRTGQPRRARRSAARRFGPSRSADAG